MQASKANPGAVNNPFPTVKVIIASLPLVTHPLLSVKLYPEGI